MKFRATVELGGKTATGIEVPEDVVAALGPGKRPAVRVTIAGHTYRTTVERMGGRFLVPLSAENRTAAGVAAGDQIDVGIEADAGPREVEVPADLAKALAQDDAARATFDGLSYTHRKEWVRWVEEAKKAETRATRLAKTVESLRAGKRARLGARRTKSRALGVRPAADDGGDGDEADPAAGRPALSGFPQALVDQPGHRFGVLAGAVHEQFVVQAQHDLGAVIPAPRPDDDRPHLEQLRRGPLDHRVAGVPAVGRGGAAASWFRGGEHDQAATIGAQVTPGPPGTVGVIEVGHSHRVGRVEAA